MTTGRDDERGRTGAERHARRLIRAYPRAWRVRYGEEFAALLADDIHERPRSVRRTLNVIRCGLTERLTAPPGTTSTAAAPEALAATATGLVGLASIPVLVLGVALWSQLTVGWRWVDPSSPAIHAGMLLMCIALGGLVVTSVAAALPIVAAVMGAVRRGRGPALVAPLCLFAVGTAGMLVGSRHFGHAWPGTGGRAWGAQGLVPANVGSTSWAATLWITSYWAHPGALRLLSAGRIAWMLLSPLASLAMVIGLTVAVRRALPLSRRALRFEVSAAVAGIVPMMLLLAGACAWVFAREPGGGLLFKPGAIDLAALCAMAVALSVATGAAKRALGARARLTGST